MGKSEQEVAAAAMQEVKERTLSGGRLDKAMTTEAEYSVFKEEAQATIGRWYLGGNAGAYELFVGLARQKGVQVSERPARAEVALREVEEGTFVLVRPCKNAEPGMAVTYPKKDPRSMKISKLHAFLKRNNLVPQVRTVLKAPVEVGKDSELGRCLMINVTEARQRVIMKKAKKGAPAEETKAPETAAPAPANENT